MNLKRLIAPVLGAFLLCGCAGAPADNNAMADSAVCVISGEDATDGPTADYNGTTVHFCCDRCKAKWDDMDNAKRDELVAKLK